MKQVDQHLGVLPTHLCSQWKLTLLPCYPEAFPSNFNFQEAIRNGKTALQKPRRERKGRWTLDKPLLSHSWLHLTANCCSLISPLFSPPAFPQLGAKTAFSVGLGGPSAGRRGGGQAEELPPTDHHLKPPASPASLLPPSLGPRPTSGLSARHLPGSSNPSTSSENGAAGQSQFEHMEEPGGRRDSQQVRH